MLAVILSYLLLISANLSIGGVIRQTDDVFRLSIIHFNDFHARFEETSPTSTKCNPGETDCIGGFARLYSEIHRLKEEDPDSVLLNAGDDFQGTLWYNILKWNVTQYFMNMLPIDAQTIGNHEFDDKVEGLAPYLKARTLPILVANMNVTEEPLLNGLYNDTVIIERKGEKIGIIGVLIQSTPSLSSTGNVRFANDIETVQKEADRLTEVGINKIIVISHCGINIDREMAARVKNIDLIVGGHSHSLLYPKGETPPNGEQAVGDYPTVVRHPTGETVLIVQASAFTKFLGNLAIDFDSNGAVQSWDGRPIYLDSSIKPDEDILELMQPFKEQVDAIGHKTIGTSLVLLDKSNCGSGDCNIGNMLTDSFVEHCVDLAPEDSWTLASVGLINNGGIRTNIDRGNITYEDLVLAQPFSNQVQKFELQGKHILETFEFAANNWAKLQVSGLHIVLDLKNEVGSRVVSAKIRCSKCVVPTYSDIDPEEMYSIVTTNFLADGGDGYTVISENKKNPINLGTDIDIVEKYIRKNSPLYSEVEGRLVYLT